MNLNNQKKNSIVNKVFDAVNAKYDLMNDLMSFGVHRQWKKNLIEWMGPSKNEKLIKVDHPILDNLEIEKIRNIEKLTKDQIIKEIDKFKKDLFNFRFQKINSQVTNPAKINETKKTIARLKTTLKGKINA